MLLSDSDLSLVPAEIQNVHFIFIMWDTESVMSEALC